MQPKLEGYGRSGVAFRLDFIKTIGDLEDHIFAAKCAMVIHLRKKGIELNPRDIKIELENNKFKCSYDYPASLEEK